MTDWPCQSGFISSNWASLLIQRPCLCIVRGFKAMKDDKKSSSHPSCSFFALALLRLFLRRIMADTKAKERGGIRKCICQLWWIPFALGVPTPRRMGLEKMTWQKMDGLSKRYMPFGRWDRRLRWVSIAWRRCFSKFAQSLPNFMAGEITFR